MLAFLSLNYMVGNVRGGGGICTVFSTDDIFNRPGGHNSNFYRLFSERGCLCVQIFGCLVKAKLMIGRR